MIEIRFNIAIYFLVCIFALKNIDYNNANANGRTDGRDGWNSYEDVKAEINIVIAT